MQCFVVYCFTMKNLITFTQLNDVWDSLSSCYGKLFAGCGMPLWRTFKIACNTLCSLFTGINEIKQAIVGVFKKLELWAVILNRTQFLLHFFTCASPVFCLYICSRCLCVGHQITYFFNFVTFLVLYLLLHWIVDLRLLKFLTKNSFVITNIYLRFRA